MYFERCLSSVVVMMATVSLLVGHTDSRSSGFSSPCTQSPNCLRDVIQSALPGFILGNEKIGTERLDPFLVDKLDLELPGDLKLMFYRGHVRGLSKCKVETASYKEETLQIQYRCNLTIAGKYKATGNLLLFKINGDGDTTIKCRDIHLRTVAKLGLTPGADGRELYFQILKANTTHSFDGRVQYTMSNIFQGNPTLSNAIVSFMNRHWKTVADEFGQPIVDFGIKSVMKNLYRLVSVVPAKQIIGGTF